MLTAWGFAGLLGPTLIAYVRQSTGYYTEALDAIALVMFLSAILPFVVRPPKTRAAVSVPNSFTQVALDNQKQNLNAAK